MCLFYLEKKKKKQKQKKYFVTGRAKILVDYFHWVEYSFPRRKKKLSHFDEKNVSSDSKTRFNKPARTPVSNAAWRIYLQSFLSQSLSPIHHFLFTQYKFSTSLPFCVEEIPLAFVFPVQNPTFSRFSKQQRHIPASNEDHRHKVCFYLTTYTVDTCCLRL